MKTARQNYRAVKWVGKSPELGEVVYSEGRDAWDSFVGWTAKRHESVSVSLHVNDFVVTVARIAARQSKVFSTTVKNSYHPGARYRSESAKVKFEREPPSYTIRAV